MEEEKENNKENKKVWKCRHCIFLKKDLNRGNMRQCAFGGKLVQVSPANVACDNFLPSRRACAVGKYRVRVEAGLVGKPSKKWKPDPNISAKEMLERLQKHLRKNVDDEQQPPRPKPMQMSFEFEPRSGSRHVPKEERTNAFAEQMCVGRCCKRKEICKHYASWVEHGRPTNLRRMISAVRDCINDTGYMGTTLHYSHFLLVDGASEDDIKEYADVL